MEASTPEYPSLLGDSMPLENDHWQSIFAQCTAHDDQLNPYVEFSDGLFADASIDDLDLNMNVDLDPSVYLGTMKRVISALLALFHTSALFLYLSTPTDFAIMMNRRGIAPRFPISPPHYSLCQIQSLLQSKHHPKLLQLLVTHNVAPLA